MVELALVHPHGPSPFHFACKKADGKENKFFQMLGYRGEGMWLPPMCLKNRQEGDSDTYAKIRITAEWLDKKAENPQCVRDEGKVGIWLPVDDMGDNLDAQGEAHNIGPLRPLNFDSNDIPRQSFNAKVLQASWDSGQKAIIDLTSKDGAYHGVPLSMYCVPVWNKEEIGCENAELKVKVSGRRHGMPGFQTLQEFDMIFEMVTDKEEDDGHLHWLLQNLNALDNKGMGNSIHPKQLITIKQVQTCIKKLIDIGKNNIRIAYIGSDTTENLRSVLRFLDANNEGDYVSNFQVFMTPDWDHEILEQLGPTYSLDKCRFKNKQIEPHTLPKMGKMPSIDDTADIVIATYVTPWATSEFEQGAQYRHLLDKLLGEASVLITTDPKSSSKSVRSRLDEHYNANALLTGYGLKPDDNMVTSHPMVSSKLWRRANG
mgnify:CR=1 FL=1|tara:strand:- start:103 stop:1392 length:1290 start_codon:yes stop_codon:yes gene_type:complete